MKKIIFKLFPRFNKIFNLVQMDSISILNKFFKTNFSFKTKS